MLTEEFCYGKFRGTVVNNIDPHKLDRLYVQSLDELRENTIERYYNYNIGNQSHINKSGGESWKNVFGIQRF